MRQTILCALLLLLPLPAAAEIGVSGDARMGLAYDSEAPRKWSFTNRLRVNFTATGQTDGGLRFGAEVRLDEAGEPSSGAVFIGGGNGSLRLDGTGPGG